MSKRITWWSIYKRNYCKLRLPLTTCIIKLQIKVYCFLSLTQIKLIINKCYLNFISRDETEYMHLRYSNIISSIDSAFTFCCHQAFKRFKLKDSNSTYNFLVTQWGVKNSPSSAYFASYKPISEKYYLHTLTEMWLKCIYN